MKRVADIPAHFESQLVPEPNSGCWLWTGYVNAAGYGVLYGRFPDGCWQKKAHRFAFESKFGDVPRGLVLDHKCRTRSCVNPDHLEAVTDQENFRRGEKYEKLRSGVCSRGHIVRIHWNGRGFVTHCNTCRTAARHAKTVTSV